MIAKVWGNSKIRGEVSIGGAKNAALPILVASILSSKRIEILRIPDLADVREMISMLRALGVDVSFENNSISMLSTNLNSDISAFPSKIRASILLLGPLALKTGKAKISYPGGCSIGKRPIDIHLDGLRKLGFDVSVGEEFVEAVPIHRYKQVDIRLGFPSVGATEHLMTTASMMRGTETRLLNCAREPEIVDLQRFLNSMGARISGAGTSKICITGVSQFLSARYEVIGDRIEAGTYAIATMASGGKLVIKGVTPSTLNFVGVLQKIGGIISIKDDSMCIKASDLKSIKVFTAPYPGFPTDLQPQITVLACKAKGISEISEKIFENRLGHVEELRKMGAILDVAGQTIRVKGPQVLHGARVVGKDLRETAAITIASAIANGTSEIENFEILFRGYEKVVEKLNKIGVRIATS